MRTFTLACLLLALSACKKFDGTDIPRSDKVITGASHDTIPDHAAFTLRLSADGNNYDETAFLFDRNASTAFSQDNDAIYFPGFGQVSLASISSNGKYMAIYSLPYQSGMSVCLDVHSKKDATLSLQLRQVKNIPAGIRIWIKDAYSRDSLNLCRGPYNFRVDKADTNSYGGRRLKLMLVSGPPVYWPDRD